MITGNVSFFQSLIIAKDKRWAIIWLSAIATVGIWDLLFLNKPAFTKVVIGFVNTFTIASLVVICTLFLGWSITLSLHYLEKSKNRSGFIIMTFVINLFRSIPQIVGVLFTYIAISSLITSGKISSNLFLFPLMSLCMSLFIVNELVDLMRERIDYFKKLDFYNAMRICGISESRIINFDILWKNSRIHIFNKLIAIFGSAVFLQCSVDFIISVGLSTEVNSVTLPVTLGSLLAKIDSKQVILAIGNTLTNPAYFSHLFFQHLLGVTVAFLIVFSLLCIYHISNGYAERHRL
jgi:ABC-type dipeptide/oligopeptide/nickel transport system permease subunit